MTEHDRGEPNFEVTMFPHERVTFYCFDIRLRKIDRKKWMVAAFEIIKNPEKFSEMEVGNARAFAEAYQKTVAEEASTINSLN